MSPTNAQIATTKDPAIPTIKRVSRRRIRKCRSMKMSFCIQAKAIAHKELIKTPQRKSKSEE
jgi:hypothetical protein